MTLKKYYLSIIISLNFEILRRITTFSECHSVFFVVIQNDVASEIKTSDVTFNVACELSQPMGKIEFSTTVKIEQILSHR